MSEILDDFKTNDESETQYSIAGRGKRLANYFIDLIGYMLFSGVIGVLIALVLSPESQFFEESETAVQKIKEYLLGIIIITVYYSVQEYFFKGKTLGKLITKTRAVTMNNGKLTFADALKRSLCRLIPFEAFTFFDDNPRGWHDSIPNTKVIDDIGWFDDEHQLTI